MTCGVCNAPVSTQATQCGRCGSALAPGGAGASQTLPVGSQMLEVHADGQTQTLALTARSYRIGRHPDNDVVVTAPGISRTHALIEQSGGGYRVRDNNSTNGTWVGQQRVPTADLVDGGEVVLDLQGRAPVRLIYRSSRSGQAKPGRFQPVALASSAPVVLGRDPGCHVLGDPSASRQHAILERDGANNWVIRDLGSFNGTFVDGVRVTSTVLRPGATIQIGNTRITFDGQRLFAPQVVSGMRIDARGVRFAGRKGAVLLNDVSLSIAPGELVALLGPSGAGKSTLLNALSGLIETKPGAVLIDGLPIGQHSARLRSAIGYVPQDDIIHRDLPVERALWYAGRLRLPPDTSQGDVMKRVETVLKQVGLIERRNLPVSLLSGGQRKRVNIAVELLTRPPVLLLDEPTSGLDPGLDRQVMTLLQQFAQDGQTVIVATHAVGNIDLCDLVVMLTVGGNLAFVGSPTEARAHFKVQDFADIYRRLDLDATPTEWRADYRKSPYHQRYVENRLARPAAPPSAPPLKAWPLRSISTIRSVVNQFATLFARQGEMMWRKRMGLLFLLAQAPAIALMLWAVADHDVLTHPRFPVDAHKMLFLFACSASWLGTISSVQEIVKEIAIVDRERNVGVGLVAYVISKFTALGLLTMAQAFLLVLFVLPWFELPRTGLIWPTPVELYITLLLTSLAGVTFGLALSSISSSPDRAMSLMPLLLIPQIVFAGTIFELNGLASGISAVTAARPSVEALGSTIQMMLDAHGHNLASSTRTTGYLVGRWQFLTVLIVGGFLATMGGLVMRGRWRQTAERLLGRSP